MDLVGWAKSSPRGLNVPWPAGAPAAPEDGTCALGSTPPSGTWCFRTASSRSLGACSIVRGGLRIVPTVLQFESGGWGLVHGQPTMDLGIAWLVIQPEPGDRGLGSKSMILHLEPDSRGPDPKSVANRGIAGIFLQPQSGDWEHGPKFAVDHGIAWTSLQPEPGSWGLLQGQHWINKLLERICS